VFGKVILGQDEKSVTVHVVDPDDLDFIQKFVVPIGKDYTPSEEDQFKYDCLIKGPEFMKKQIDTK
jgi:hypothetical protein